MDEESPTARTLQALELIQTQPGITADRIGAALGVSERAARRYVAALRNAGIAIDGAVGPYGGYRVGRGLRLPPLMFSSDEALAVVMAVLDGHHDPANPDDPAGTAIAKILRGLPAAVAAKAEAVRHGAAPAPDRAAVRPDPSTTSALVEASNSRRRVRLRYTTEAGSAFAVDADPWAVVVRHGRWYLLCHSIGSQATRAYRVDRIQGVEILTDTFVPPADLDPVSALESHLAVGWEYGVEVAIDAPPDSVRRTLSPAMGRLEALGDDKTRLIGTTSNPTWYAEQLATIHVDYTVESGEEVRAAVHELGGRLLRSSASPNSS